MTSISKNEDYYCPDCDSIIEFGQTKCNNCGCHIDWSDEIKEDLTYSKDVILKNNNYKGEFIKKEKTNKEDLPSKEAIAIYILITIILLLIAYDKEGLTSELLIIPIISIPITFFGILFYFLILNLLGHRK